MGLVSNLKVLVQSDIGDNVRELKRKLVQLQAEMDDAAELAEARFRRLNKRARDRATASESDDQEPGNGTAPLNPKVEALLKRRAGRGRYVGIPGE